MFLLLHTEKDAPVLVNAEHISRVRPCGELGRARLIFPDGTETTTLETFERVTDLLRPRPTRGGTGAR